MKMKFSPVILMAACMLLPKIAAAVSPTAEEMSESHRWAAANFAGDANANDASFFSFKYDGRSSAEFLETWKIDRTTRRLDAQRTEHTLTYSDPNTGLTIRCVGVEYDDFPTVEWTLYFKNTSDRDTPILEDIQALDIKVQGKEFCLHHNVGSPCKSNDYQPLETVLTPGMEKRISTVGGRPTDSNMPYFNLQTSANEGLIAVIGWPGQWAAAFSRNAENNLRIVAGQELTHFKLLPGEQVRSPLVVLQFWKGDRLRSQNVWRRWMLAHNLPRPGGKLPPVELAACSSHQFEEMYKADAKSQKFFIDRYLEEGLKLDYWWMDAGWYPCDPMGWPKTGTWEVDARRFPNGLREVSDHAHAKNVKIVVWFEPERVRADTWLADKHPEWILGGKPSKNGNGLLNLGNPEAWNWLVNHVDRLITDQGVDLYRQDFNMEPLGYWRKADADDRRGITEIKHVMGYLAYWDELRCRHPNMLIDTCASGGRRNDLETLRRAVPLLRSDYIFEPVGNQGHTYGIASWIPYYGTGGNSLDSYVLRSTLCPAFNACLDMRNRNLNYVEARRLLGQWRNFSPYFLGDYYPLTPYSLGNADWIAWQFYSPEKGEGMIQAFRRDKCDVESNCFQLHAIEPNAVYALTDMDADGSTEMTGRELMEQGLPVSIKAKPGAAVIIYKKKS